MNFKLAVSFIGLVLALATPRSALAQLEKSLSITSQYDDNAFGNFQKLSDYVTQLSLNLSGDYDKDYSVWTVSYVGNLNLFNKHAFRNYHAHTLGVSYAMQLNPEEETEDSTGTDVSDSVSVSQDSVVEVTKDSSKNFLFAGASLAGRFNRDSVNYYNDAYASGYVRLRWMLTESLVGRLTYTVGYRNYFNLTDLSNLENALSVHVMENVGGTKLIAEAGYGYKKYFSTTTDTTELLKLGVTPGGGGPGKGKGKGKGSGGGSGDHRSEEVERGVVITRLSTPGTSQITLGVGLVRSISKETEIGVKYLRRMSPSLNARYISGQFRGYGSNDDIYDDSYSYQSHEFSGFFKQSFPWAMTVGIQIGYMPKRYGRSAYSLPDSLGRSAELSSSRKDQKFELNVELEKVFKFTNGFAKTLALQVGYYFLNNRSNDDFYRFTNNMISVGISTDF